MKKLDARIQNLLFLYYYSFWLNIIAHQVTAERDCIEIIRFDTNNHHHHRKKESFAGMKN